MNTVQAAWERYRDHFYPDIDPDDVEYIEYLRTVFFDGALSIFLVMNHVDEHESEAASAAIWESLQDECEMFNEQQLAEADSHSDICKECEEKMSHEH